MRVIYLPLASKPGRLPRVVGYFCELEPHLSIEILAERRSTMDASWIDIGAGVPANPPNLPGKPEQPETPA